MTSYEQRRRNPFRAPTEDHTPEAFVDCGGEAGCTKQLPKYVPIIIVHARESISLSQILAACRAQTRWITDPVVPPELRRSDDCCIALVGVETARANPQSAVASVRGLAKKDFRIACYSEGCKLTLPDQCLLLLAGASIVLDGTDPAFATRLSEWVQRALDVEVDLQGETRRFESELSALGIVGRSPALLDVFRWAAKAGPFSRLPVLITGETGTGKELVARAIHHFDPLRCSRPFVPVNCGAINAGLAESELFGHRRGAFTGADRERRGLVRAASGGIFFLDEIGDLDPVVQGKLLRVLQERRILGVGEDHEVAVDVRVVAATNRDLREMVRHGTFRADLFHRLNVLSIRVPALRERVEDIEPLVRHFLHSFEHRKGRPLSVSEEFLDAMKRAHLPGNVRELENLVLSAYVSSRNDGHIGLNTLPPEVWHQLASPGAALGVDRNGSTPARSDPHEIPPDAAHNSLDPLAILQLHNWSFERCIDFCEYRIVTAALGAASGNLARAAKLLGISPRGLFNKRRKHRVA